MSALSIIRLFRCTRYVPVLRKFTEYIFALCDLLQAEARALGHAARRVALGIVVLLLGGLLLATGFGFLVAGVYLVLAATLNAWAGALITGGIVALVGCLVAWIGLKATR